MDNKYYTPELEEFCIGFEYEEYQQKEWNKLISPPKSLGYEWVKKVFDTSTSLGKIKHNVEGMNWMIDGVDKGHPTCKIKVKYLDKEDIESLGWSYFKKSYSKHLKEDCIVFNSEKYNCILAYYPKTSRISVATLDPSKNETMLKTNWDDKQVNLISCKNKMELKKLLKQLEI
jgi:hypothetical protein